MLRSVKAGRISEYARTYYPEWRSYLNSSGISFIPNAYPGFNITELPLNGTMFGELLNIAYDNVDYNLSMMMTTSWNEWEESTSIEPSLEYGEQFLHHVYTIPEFPSLVILTLLIATTLPIAILHRRKRQV